MATARKAAPKPTAAEIEAELRRKQAFWKGKVRYYKMDGGEKRIFPEWMGTPHWAPEGMVREICKNITVEGNPIWVIAPNAPHPQGQFQAPASHSIHDENPAAPSPPYDYRPPAYASDTQSGGPANFDGNAGGNDNPRNPDVEGETPGEYDQKLMEFQKTLKGAAGSVDGK